MVSYFWICKIVNKKKYLSSDLNLSPSFLKAFFPPSSAYHQGRAAWNTFTSEFSSTACTVKFNGHQGKNICWSNNIFSRFIVSITPGCDLILYLSHLSQHATEFFQFHGTLEVLQNSAFIQSPDKALSVHPNVQINIRPSIWRKKNQNKAKNPLEVRSTPSNASLSAVTALSCV